MIQDFDPPLPDKAGEKKKIIFLIAGFVLFFGIVAGLIFFAGYSRYFSPLSQASVKTAEFKFEGSLVLRRSYGTSQIGSRYQPIESKAGWDLESRGKVDITNPDEPKVSIFFTSGRGYQTRIDYLSDGRNAYAKIDSDLPIGNVYAANNFTGKWLKLDNENFWRKMDTVYPEFDTGAPWPEFNAKTVNALLGLMRETNFVENDSMNDMGIETVNGVDCRHYQARIDKAGLLNYIRETGIVLEGWVPARYPGMLFDIVNDADLSVADIYLAQKDGRLVRVRGGVSFKTDDGQTADFAGTFDLVQTGAAVVIEAPRDAQAVSEIINDLASRLPEKRSLSDDSRPVSGQTGCARESQVLNGGLQCCAGLVPLANVYPKNGNNCTTPVNMNYGSDEFTLVCANCGNGFCGPGENICNCAKDCDPQGTARKIVASCSADKDCGQCKLCRNGYCEDVTTDWGEGAYECAAGVGDVLNRCYKGECKNCGGSLIFDMEAGRKGCWYLAEPGVSCENFCKKKGCDDGEIAVWHWGDGAECSVGKKLTGCSKCSDDYENGWWVPYYDKTKDTCFYYLGAGIPYACSKAPKVSNIQRMCVCGY